MNPSWPEASGATPWHVLVVSANPARVTLVRQALSDWPAPTVLDVASTTVAALRQVWVQPPRLAVVDWALEQPGAQTLVHQLGRLRPTVAVLAFDHLGDEDRSRPVQIWPWDDANTVLERWLLLQAEHP